MIFFSTLKKKNKLNKNIFLKKQMVWASRCAREQSKFTKKANNEEKKKENEVDGERRWETQREVKRFTIWPVEEELKGLTSSHTLKYGQSRGNKHHYTDTNSDIETHLCEHVYTQ